MKNIHLVRLSLYLVCKNLNSIAKMLIGWCSVCTVGPTGTAWCLWPGSSWASGRNGALSFLYQQIPCWRDTLLKNVLCTGAFLYVRCSFRMISNKFCDLSLKHHGHCSGQYRDVGGGGSSCGDKNLLHWALELMYIKLPTDSSDWYDPVSCM
jgi:hypothetical protein